MEQHSIKNFNDYLDIIDDFIDDNDIIALYRGQSDKKPLLPSIARGNAKFDTTNVEKKMLLELKRKSNLLFTKELTNDWDWLIYAQHFGMKTRLLDWTTNPLAALWFACSNEYRTSENSYVYLFIGDKDLLLNKGQEESPFVYSKTKILKPALNNERIIAQSGWFTAHKYSKKAKKFVPLEHNPELNPDLLEIIIPYELKPLLMKKLNIMGVNSFSLFPDISGACSQINWEFNNKMIE